MRFHVNMEHEFHIICIAQPLLGNGSAHHWLPLSVHDSSCFPSFGIHAHRWAHLPNWERLPGEDQTNQEIDSIMPLLWLWRMMAIGILRGIFAALKAGNKLAFLDKRCGSWPSRLNRTGVSVFCTHTTCIASTLHQNTN